MIIVFDAENIQLRTWYKRIKNTFVNCHKDAVRWQKTYKVAIYNKSNEQTAEKTWNDSVDSILASGDADSEIVNFISTLPNKKRNKDVFIATNDKKLVMDIYKSIKGRNLIQLYTNDTCCMKEKLGINTIFIKKETK